MGASSTIRGVLAAALLLVIMIGAVLLGRQLRARTTASAASESASLHRGEVIYQVQCAKCHGVEGRGDAEGAARLNPPPRDFASRPWKTEPTSERIREVIAQGIPGTAMPAAPSLTGQDLDSVVRHVLQLANKQPYLVQESADHKLMRAANFLAVRSPEPAPLLELVDAGGRQHQLQAQQGKLVLINFWGTNCEHCLKKLPQLSELRDKYRDRGLVVWNICADVESASEAQAIVDRIAPGAVTFVDESGLANHRFEVQALPTVWLIASDGKAIARSQGVQDWTSPAMQALVEHWLP